MEYTTIIKNIEGWRVGWIEEIPAAISQGKTVDELKVNLLDAFSLLMEVNKENTGKQYINKDVIREDLLLV